MNPNLVTGIFAQRWSEDPYLDSQINHFYRLKEVERQLHEAEMRVDHMERRARAALEFVITTEARFQKIKNSLDKLEQKAKQGTYPKDTIPQ